MKHTISELEEKAFWYRRRFLDLFSEPGFGHLTSAYSWAEIATVLYNEILEISYTDKGPLMVDKMVVSKGLGVVILFQIFDDRGFFSRKEMEDTIKLGGSNKRLRQLYYPGFDFYGGSLGIGIGIAVGLAKGAKLRNEKWKVFCILGDAECYEGAVWEAVIFAGHNKLDNLTVIVDRNGLGCSDFTEHMLQLEPFADKWNCNNWSVSEGNGHSISYMYQALRQANEDESGRPQCIIAHTKKGKGLDYLVDKPLMHGYMPKGDAVEKAYRFLDLKGAHMNE